MQVIQDWSLFEAPLEIRVNLCFRSINLEVKLIRMKNLYLHKNYNLNVNFLSQVGENKNITQTSLCVIRTTICKKTKNKVNIEIFIHFFFSLNDNDNIKILNDKNPSKSLSFYTLVIWKYLKFLYIFGQHRCVTRYNDDNFSNFSCIFF
jgi:hypothetical protein